VPDSDLGTLLDDLVIANRILAHEDVIDAFGHVSVRHPERPDRYFLYAVLALGTMSGALFFHLTRLGIEVRGDHGQLFLYALLVFGSCLILTWSFRKQLCVL